MLPRFAQMSFPCFNYIYVKDLCQRLKSISVCAACRRSAALFVRYLRGTRTALHIAPGARRIYRGTIPGRVFRLRVRSLAVWPRAVVLRTKCPYVLRGRALHTAARRQAAHTVALGRCRCA